MRSELCFQYKMDVCCAFLENNYENYGSHTQWKRKLYSSNSEKIVRKLDEL